MLSPSLSQAAGKEVANRRASIHWDEESLNDDAHGRFFLFLPLVFLSSFVRGSR